jgi:hypothetical protein
VLRGKESLSTASNCRNRHSADIGYNVRQTYSTSLQNGLSPWTKHRRRPALGPPISAQQHAAGRHLQSATAVVTNTPARTTNGGSAPPKNSYGNSPTNRASITQAIGRSPSHTRALTPTGGTFTMPQLHAGQQQLRRLLRRERHPHSRRIRLRLPARGAFNHGGPSRGRTEQQASPTPVRRSGRAGDAEARITARRPRRCRRQTQDVRSYLVLAATDSPTATHQRRSKSR